LLLRAWWLQDRQADVRTTPGKHLWSDPAGEKVMTALVVENSFWARRQLAVSKSPYHGIVYGLLDERVPATGASQHWPCRTFVFWWVSSDWPEPPPDHLNELPTTPDNPKGEHSFTITHPFHPLYGHTFPLLSQRFSWGEERVFFSDQETH
jgi:hypothetical protein